MEKTDNGVMTDLQNMKLSLLCNVVKTITFIVLVVIINFGSENYHIWVILRP